MDDKAKLVAAEKAESAANILAQWIDNNPDRFAAEHSRINPRDAMQSIQWVIQTELATILRRIRGA